MARKYAKSKSKLFPKEAHRAWVTMPHEARVRAMPERKGKPCYYPAKVTKISKTGKRYVATVWKLDKKCKARLIERKRYKEALRRVRKKRGQ